MDGAKYFSRNNLSSAGPAGALLRYSVECEPVICPGGLLSPPRYIATGERLEAGIDQLQRFNLEFQQNSGCFPIGACPWGLS